MSFSSDQYIILKKKFEETKNDMLKLFHGSSLGQSEVKFLLTIPLNQYNIQHFWMRIVTCGSFNATKMITTKLSNVVGQEYFLIIAEYVIAIVQTGVDENHAIFNGKYVELLKAVKSIMSGNIDLINESGLIESIKEWIRKHNIIGNDGNNFFVYPHILHQIEILGPQFYDWVKEIYLDWVKDISTKNILQWKSFKNKFATEKSIQKIKSEFETLDSSVTERTVEDFQKINSEFERLKSSVTERTVEDFQKIKSEFERLKSSVTERTSEVLSVTENTIDKIQRTNVSNFEAWELQFLVSNFDVHKYWIPSREETWDEEVNDGDSSGRVTQYWTERRTEYYQEKIGICTFKTQSSIEDQFVLNQEDKHMQKHLDAFINALKECSEFQYRDNVLVNLGDLYTTPVEWYWRSLLEQ